MNSQTPLIPWSIDRVTVAFNEDVAVRADDLWVTGGRGGQYSVIAFQYSSVDRTAVWDINIAQDDWLQLGLSNKIQATATGLFVDADTSANSGESDPALFTARTLTADINGDGLVDNADELAVKDAMFARAGDDRYNIFADLDANGKIDHSDLSYISRNTGARITNNPPQDNSILEQIVVSPINVGTLDEDFQQLSIPFALNTNRGSENELHLTVSTADPSVLLPENLKVTGSGALRTLTITALPDAHGQTTATLTITQGTTEYDLTIPISIRAVNDPPRATPPSGPVRLTNDTPNRTFSLHKLFTDSDDANLNYELVSWDQQLLDVRIENAKVSITAYRNQVGFTDVILRATDSKSLSATVLISIEVNREDLTPLPYITAFTTPDQIISYHSTARIRITTNFSEKSRILLKVQNTDVLTQDDFSIEHINATEFEIIIQHTKSDYGISLITLEVENIVITEFLCMVLPPPNTPNTYSIADFSTSMEIFPAAGVALRRQRTFNDRQLAWLVAERHARASNVLQALRPASHLESAYVHALNGGKIQLQSIPTASNQADRMLEYTVELPSINTFYGRVKWNDDIVADTYAENLRIAYMNSFFNADDPTGSVFSVLSVGLSVPALLTSAAPLAVASLLIAVVAPASTAYMVTKTSEDLNLVSVAELDANLSKLAAAEQLLTLLDLCSSSLDGLDWLMQNGDTIAKHPDKIRLLLGALKKTQMSVLDKLNIVNSVYSGVQSLIPTNSTDPRVKELYRRQYLRELDKDVFRLATFSERAETNKVIIKSVHARIINSDSVSSDIRTEVLRTSENVEDIYRGFETSYREQKQRRERISPEFTGTVDESDFSDPSEVRDPITAESLGENGDTWQNARDFAATGLVDQQFENGGALAEYDSYKRAVIAAENWNNYVRSAVSVYELTRESLDLFKTIDDIIDTSAGESGDYVDHDGKTYNINQAQAGENQRRGTNGADFIKGSRKGDELYGEGGDDQISGRGGDDEIDGGGGFNVLIGGPGHDRIFDGVGHSSILAGIGNDLLAGGSGSDILDGSEGRDYYFFDQLDFGNDVIIDGSREGIIHFSRAVVDQLVFVKEKDGLVLSFPETESSVLFADFFSMDAGGWALIDATGSEYSLYALTGRFSAYDVIRVAFGRDPSGRRLYPDSITPVRSVLIPEIGLQLEVAKDSRVALSNSSRTGGFAVVFDSMTGYGARGFLERNRFGGLENLSRVAAALENVLKGLPIESSPLTLVGLGDGGVAAQWIAAYISTRYPILISTYVVNAPDVSGVISHAAASSVFADGPTGRTLASQGLIEYRNGFSNVTTDFINHVDDLPSKLGMFSGPESIWATVRTFSFDPDASTQHVIISESELEEAHRQVRSPDAFSTVVITSAGDILQADYSEFDDLVSLTTELVHINALSDLEPGYTSTVARLLSNDRDWILNAEDASSATQADRLAFHQLLRPAAYGVREGKDWSISLDLQASSQQGEHLRPGMLELTEQSLYVEGVSQYGWKSLNSLRAGEDEGRADLALRDSIKVNSASLLISLKHEDAGAGWYNVYISTGSKDAAQEQLLILMNGRQRAAITTMPGDILTNSFQVFTMGELLEIQFLDFGGSHAFTSVSAVVVQKVNFRDDIRSVERIVEDQPLIVATRDYSLPESSKKIEAIKIVAIAVATKIAGAAVGWVLAAVGKLAGAAALGTAAAVGGPAVSTKLATTAAVSTKVGTAAQTKFQLVLKAAATAVKYYAKKKVESNVSKLIVRSFGAEPRESYQLLHSAHSLFENGKVFFEAWKKDPISNVQQVEDGSSQGDFVNQMNKATATIGFLNAGLRIVKNRIEAKADSEFSNVAPWIVEALGAYADQISRSGFGVLDTNFRPVDAELVASAIRAGKSNEELLRFWKGSRQVLVLDWTPKHRDILELEKPEHLARVKSYSNVLARLIEALTEQKATTGEKLDVLFMSHGLGYELNREAFRRLEMSEAAGSFEYVKFVTLDPIASSYDSFKWYHPELSVGLDSIDNYYSNERIGGSWFSELGGTKIGTTSLGRFTLLHSTMRDSYEDDVDFFHGGSVVGGLDGRDAGGKEGFYNRQAQIIDRTTKKEQLRFRHFDRSTAYLASAEMTDVEFSPDGSLIATSDRNGQVDVRYVNDVQDPESTTGALLHAAGDIAFTVWGHESIVRSIEFAELEQDGKRQLYLLSISSAKNPENRAVDRNKVLLTDAATGLPVWQGFVRGGTQVSMSPSGNLIVTTDRYGYAQIWRRVPGEVRYLADDKQVAAHVSANSDWITDVIAVSDRFFVTSGLDGTVKTFRIDPIGATLLQTERFDNPNEGAVRNLDYDPYTGLLAAGSGEVLSLWRFDQYSGRIRPLAASAALSPPRFLIHDHIRDIQGIAFSKPAFLLNAKGEYNGDLWLDVNGRRIGIPRSEFGDIDQVALVQLLKDHDLPMPWIGTALVTGGEDRTVFTYSLAGLPIGSVRQVDVISGSMLPVRELAVSADGRRIAMVGEDNIDGMTGGPVRDFDVTEQLDQRLGWAFSELFLSGRREHNAVPEQYVIDVIQGRGESFFWDRNSLNANRPSDLDAARNRALPPNKRARLPGVDMEQIKIFPRPGEVMEISPLKYVLETDRQHFAVRQDTFKPGNVTDADGVVIGTITQKVANGKAVPDVFVFHASSSLDYSALSKREYTGVFRFDIRGPAGIDGNSRNIDQAEIHIHVVNHRPVAVRDIVELHPNRSVTNFRPGANDYDFDNDELRILPFQTQWLTIAHSGVSLLRYRRTPDTTSGVDVDVLVTEETLAQLISDDANNGGNGVYLPIELPYSIRETMYAGTASGVIEVRLQNQAGPTNVRYSEHGADQVLIHWDPVSWHADIYIVQIWIDDGTPQGTWKRLYDSAEVRGRQSNSLRVRISPQREYWFRIRAVNTFSGRQHYSADTKDKALHLLPVNYVSPVGIRMESLGSERVEISWEKLFWRVDTYRVDLFKVLPDPASGLPLKDSSGRYQKDPNGFVRTLTVAAATTTIVFGKLDSGTAYIAEVSARNSNGSINLKTLSQVIAFTKERSAPVGIDFARIGPERVLVSWGTVPYASHYRAVAVEITSLERFASATINATNSVNVNSVVIKSLSSQKTYLVYVEAKVRRTGEWVQLLNEDSRAMALPNRDIGPDDLAAGLPEGIALTRILANEFAASVTLPSLSGLFVGATLTILNFSLNDVMVRTTDGTLRFGTEVGRELKLNAPFPVNSDVLGPIVLRFIAREDPENLSQLQWQLQAGDEMSEARRLITPAFEASVENKLSQSEKTRPRQLIVSWQSPFWDVKFHNLSLYTFDPAASGNRGTLIESKRILLSEVNTWLLQRTFTSLDPDKKYVVVLKTIGFDRRLLEIQQIMKTPPQFSPRDPRADQIRLREFRVSWTSVADEWSAIGYRVVLEIRDGDQWKRIRETDNRLVVDASKTQLLVTGLTEGTTYRFTVEAKTGYDNSWIPNSIVKEVNTRQPKLSDDAYLALSDQTTRTLTVNWLNVFTEMNSEGFLFGTDAARVYWREAGSSAAPLKSDELSDGDTSYVIATGLRRDTQYEVWVEFRVRSLSAPIRLNTKNNSPLRTKAAIRPRLVTIPENEIRRRGFVVEWWHDEPADVEGFAVEVLHNGIWKRVANRNSSGEYINGTNLTPRAANRFDITWLRPLGGNWEQVEPATSYSVRITATFDRGTAPLTNIDNPTVSLVTKSNEPPQKVVNSEITRNTFRVTWDPPATTTPFGYTIWASVDGGRTYGPVELLNGRVGSELPASWNTVVVAKHRLPNGNYRAFHPGQSLHIRVLALYDGGDTRATANPENIPVTLADYQAPIDLSISNVTVASAIVNWTFDDLVGDPEHFVIEVSVDDGKTWSSAPNNSKTKNAAVRTQSISKLEPNMTYLARVRSVYSTGDGKASLASTQFTTSSLQPSVTRVVVNGRRTATVLWETLAVIPNSLRLEVRRFDADAQVWTVWEVPEGGNIVQDKTHTDKQIEKLWPGSTYEVRLVTANSAGRTTISNGIAFATPGFPEITGLNNYGKTTTSVYAQWTRLETLSTGVTVTDNIVEVRLDGQLLSGKFLTGSGTGANHSVQLTGLNSGTTYELRVSAWNDGVLLSRSAWHEFSTLMDGLNVDLVTAFSARATWTQFAGRTATDYRVKVLLTGTDTLVTEKVVAIGTGLRSTTMPNLSPDVKYDMLVEVRRNGVILTSSDRVGFRTLPAELTGVKLIAVRRFSVDVEWNRVATWADWTMVQWRKVGTATWSGSGELAATRTAYTVTDLSITTNYEIRVSAGGGSVLRQVVLTCTTADFVATSKPSITALKRTEVTLDWTFSDPAGNPDFFAIWRNGNKVAEITDIKRRSYTDTGLKAGTNYTYFVRAVYKLGFKNSPEASITTPAGIAPVIDSVTDVLATRVKVNWSFMGNLEEVQSFTVHRNNQTKTQLGLLNPSQFPGKSNFLLSITRESRQRWSVFVRVTYFDGTVVDGPLYQLPY